MSNVYFGIDIGTSQCSVAYVVDSPRTRSSGTVAPQVLPIRQDAVASGPSDRFPSVVGTDFADKRRKRLLFGWDFLSMFEKRGAVRTDPPRRGRDFFSSVKSDMGSNRTYPFSRLEKGRTPVEVTARLLEHLARLVKQEKPDWNLFDSRVVLTVPASFSALARRDTIEAAEDAGFDPEQISLLDEPVAALLDAVNDPDSGSFLTDRMQHLLMFDYGGGTCDLALMGARFQGASPLGLHLETLAVSPYSRLGGDDVDRAIVDEVLWPQICSDEERRRLDPSVVAAVSDSLAVSVARRLKELVCAEIRTYQRDHNGAWPDLARIKKDLPADSRFAVPGLKAYPRSFSMRAPFFEEIMERFVAVPDDLDDPEDCPQSLLRPIVETVRKADLELGDLNRIIMNGGSSLNPFVKKMLERQFGDDSSLFSSVALSFAPSVTSSVARGAALACYWEHARNTSVVAPIMSDPMGVIVQDGRPVEIIQGGQSLPFPGEDELHEVRGEFFVPASPGTEMLVPYFTGYDGPDQIARHAGTVKVDVPPGTAAGADVTIQLRVDEDKTLHWWFSIGSNPAQQASSIEDPWTQRIASPSERELSDHRRMIRQAIAEGKSVSLELLSFEANCMRLAGAYGEALVYFNDLLDEYEPDGTAKGHLVNLRGLCHDHLGNDEQAVADFRTAAELRPDDGIPRGNLGCKLQELGLLDEAEAALRLALQLNPNLAYVYERLGTLMRAKGNEVAARRELKAAERHYVGGAEASPLDPSGWRQVARVRVALGDYEGAERARTLAGEAQEHHAFGGAKIGVISGTRETGSDEEAN